MAEGEERWTRLVRGLREGDPQIVEEFCEQYGALLQQLADKHLSEDLRRRVGPEDVVQSVCRTFLRRARAGEFELADSEGLWRLLCAITLTKVHEQVIRGTAAEIAGALGDRVRGEITLVISGA